MTFPAHAAVFWWRPAAWLRITGADSAVYLQGQFTNDLRLLAQGAAAYGLWLNVKGKVVADSFVVRGAAAEEFWIGSYFSPAATIRGRLEKFVVADDVQVEDGTGEWEGVTVFGEGAAEALAAERHEGYVFHGRRSGAGGIEWAFPTSAKHAVCSALAGLPELSADEVARRRIVAGIPAVPADIGPGDLPNEGGLEADAISYTKGCYLGQEVMARLKSMGQVRRRLMQVAISGANLSDMPAPLFIETRQVGELRSAAPDGTGGFVGLAMISQLHVAPGARLAFAPDGPLIVNVLGSR